MLEFRILGPVTMIRDGRPVDVRFVNLQSGTLHTHEVARVYTSPVQFLECAEYFL